MILITTPENTWKPWNPVIKAGTEHKVGEEITEDLMHEFQHAAIHALNLQ